MALSRPAKRGIVWGVDAVLCVLSVWLAFYLRLGVFTSLSALPVWPVLAAFLLAQPIFITSGLYRAIFRYSGLPAIVVVARAMLLYGVLYAGVFTFYGVEGVPRTVGLIQPVLLLLLVGASRSAARVWLGGTCGAQPGRGCAQQRMGRAHLCHVGCAKRRAQLCADQH